MALSREPPIRVIRSSVQAGAEPVYRRLAEVLARMIEERALRPGDRMPSVRQFSAQQRVSIPTALQAFATLEARGLVEARPKSGFYVRNRYADAVPVPRGPAGAVKLTDLAHTDPFASLLADFGDADLVPLGGALPAAELLPGARLARTMAAVARRLKTAGNTYDMPPGAPGLRRELARRSLEWGCALRPDDFIVTVAATEALSLALRVTCSAGDVVAVESPTYFGLARMLREMRLRALPIPVDSVHGMDIACLERVLRRVRVAACVVTPNFHNPVGSLMPDANKRALVQLLVARGIPLIEDDVYGDLQHHGPRPRCLKAFDASDGVILCGSFSKALAPGYRIGYLAAGRWHAAALALKRVTTLGGPTLPTLGIAEFLRNGGYERYLRTIREAYRRQVAWMTQRVLERFPAGIKLSRPQGGFLLWCELPRAIDALELARRARQAGISIAPGPLFSPDGGCRHFIRLNCGQVWNARIERAVDVVGQLARQMLGRAAGVNLAAPRRPARPRTVPELRTG